MKKIMFNDKCGLTEAVLQGRKTMTRRLVPIKEAKRLESFFDGDDWDYAKQTCIDDSATYEIGEVVAVAQSYKDLGYTKEWVVQHVRPNPNAKPTDRFEKKYPGWSNKMFVSAKFMSHQIRITDVKVEMVQSISEEDCMKEGILTMLTGYCYEYKSKRGFGYRGFSHTKDAFASLFDEVSGKGTWEQNPYVFAYTFELVKQRRTKKNESKRIDDWRLGENHRPERPYKTDFLH